MLCPTHTRDLFMKKFKMFTILTLIVSAFVLTGCYTEGDTTRNDSVYNDALASQNPKLDFTNINIPNPTFTSESGNIVRMDMAGILSPVTKDWLELVGTSTTSSSLLRAGSLGEKAKVYVEVDGKDKFILIELPDSTNKNSLVDLVFLVDNSGSMSEEADAVAEQIIGYADYLSEQRSDMDFRFGCVGYGYNSDTKIYGAINITDVNSLSSYLNRAGTYGVNRTVGYGGSYATELQQKANSYSASGGECGVLAFRYADENFNFRSKASIFYVNFTDEPNQPGGNVAWSVDYTKDPSIWKNPYNGTIHTVFSDPDTTTICQRTQLYCNYWLDSYVERPWLMSDYSGGTIIFTDPTFTTFRAGDINPAASMRAASNGSISLTSLPVTGAMVYSSIIRFKNTSKVPDGEHEVKITIQTNDKSVQGEKVFKNVTFGNK